MADNEKKRLNYKEKIRSYRLTRFYQVVLFLLIAVGVSAVFYYEWRGRVFTDSIVIHSAANRISGGVRVMGLDGHILGYSKDGVSLTDSGGTTLWNQTFEMQEPSVAICRDVVALADYNGSTIYVLDTHEKLGEINTNLPIRAFDVAASGNVLAVLEDGLTTWVNLYGADGTQISNIRTSMNNSGYPVSVAVSPNGALVGISFFFVAEGVSRSTVVFYNFGPVGQNAQNNMRSAYNYGDTLVPYLTFMSDDAAFAVSDDRIMFFAGSEKPLSIAETFLNEKVRSIYSGEDYVGLVFYGQGQDALYRLDIYDKKGEMILSKDFDFDYTEVVFSKNSFIIYNELELLICDINGTEKFRGPLDKVTILLLPTGQISRYTAVTSETIDTLEFR